LKGSTWNYGRRERVFHVKQINRQQHSTKATSRSDVLFHVEQQSVSALKFAGIVPRGTEMNPVIEKASISSTCRFGVFHVKHLAPAAGLC
jgi:hypothetical protein